MKIETIIFVIILAICAVLCAGIFLCKYLKRAKKHKCNCPECNGECSCSENCKCAQETESSQYEDETDTIEEIETQFSEVILDNVAEKISEFNEATNTENSEEEKNIVNETSVDITDYRVNNVAEVEDVHEAIFDTETESVETEEVTFLSTLTLEEIEDTLPTLTKAELRKLLETRFSVKGISRFNREDLFDTAENFVCSRAVLIAKCKDRSISGVSHLKKDELIQALLKERKSKYGKAA